MLRMIVRPTATMGPTGIGVECSLGLPRGSTARTASTAMSITAMTLITATVVPSLITVTGRLNTSAAMRRGMDEATQATRAMMRAMNVTFPDIVAAAMATTMTMANTAKEQ